jgi:hypothetical protein
LERVEAARIVSKWERPSFSGQSEYFTSKLKSTTLRIILATNIVFASCFYLKHTSFRRLHSVSVFRWNIAQLGTETGNSSIDVA